jgi:hypothetical protein
LKSDEITLIGTDCDEKHEMIASRLGISLIKPNGSRSHQTAGVFMDRPISEDDWQKLLAPFAGTKGESAVLLLYGEKIPFGDADRLAHTLDSSHVEVVRLFLLEGEKRAIIGGDTTGRWVHRLRRHLAQKGLITLVCRRIEVDEAVRHIPLYLAWKQRYVLQLGASCDVSGARLEVVAQALGMDKRIGQGWLFDHTMSPEWEREIVDWLSQQCRWVDEKTKVDRLAFWGPEYLLTSIRPLFSARPQVRLYDPVQAQKTNKPLLPAETLDGADLLIIAAADQGIRELGLKEVVSRMNRPLVIDACCCYPLPEAEGYAIKYRTLGQNTNVSEWNGLL